MENPRTEPINFQRHEMVIVARKPDPQPADSGKIIFWFFIGTAVIAIASSLYYAHQVRKDEKK